MRGHREYWMPRVEIGVVIAMGPVADPAGGYGVAIIEAPSRAALEAMQAVRSGDRVQSRLCLRESVSCRRLRCAPACRSRRSLPSLPDDRRAPRGAMTMAIEIRVPTLGESITEATVGKWFKKAGEAVRADEPLVELETDKVTLEVNAPGAGVLSEIAAETGQTVAIGALLGQLSGGAARGRGRAGGRPRLRRLAAPADRPRCRRRPPQPRSRPRTASTSPPSPAAASAARC